MEPGPPPIPTQPDRQKAWAYLITNALICPGLGSLLAKRRSGWFEMLFALLGGLQTIVVFVKFFLEYAQTMQPPADVKFYLTRGLAGVGIFLVGWVWSIITGIRVLRQAPK